MVSICMLGVSKLGPVRTRKGENDDCMPKTIYLRIRAGRGAQHTRQQQMHIKSAHASFTPQQPADEPYHACDCVPSNCFLLQEGLGGG